MSYLENYGGLSLVLSAAGFMPITIYNAGTENYTLEAIDYENQSATITREASDIKLVRPNADWGAVMLGNQAAIDMTGATKLKVTCTHNANDTIFKLCVGTSTKNMVQNYSQLINTYASLSDGENARSNYVLELDITGISGNAYFGILFGTWNNNPQNAYIYKIEIV